MCRNPTEKLLAITVPKQGKYCDAKIENVEIESIELEIDSQDLKKVLIIKIDKNNNALTYFERNENGSLELKYFISDKAVIKNIISELICKTKF